MLFLIGEAVSLFTQIIFSDHEVYSPIYHRRYKAFLL